jgi:hypothetical protein
LPTRRAAAGRRSPGRLHLHPQPARVPRARRQRQGLLRRGPFPGDQLHELGHRARRRGTATVRGALTIKGTTRDITATGTFRPPTEDPYGSLRAAIDVATTIDRREFGIGWQAQLPKGGNVLEWDVEIAVHIELIKAG